MSVKFCRVLSLLRLLLPPLLLIGWVVFIFSNSLQSGSSSGEQSKRLLELIDRLFSSVGLGGFQNEYLLRKLAHFGEFFILSVLFSWVLLSWRVLSPFKRIFSLLLWSLSSVPFCALIATVDELLQNLSDGRAPLASDVLIDSAGGLFGALLVFFILLLVRFLHPRRRVDPSEITPADPYLPFS